MVMNEEHRLRDAPYQFFKRSSSVYDWCIVEAVSTYEFAQQRSILLQAFVVVGALALLLALILASVFAERLVQPIRSMADAVDRIAQGRSTVRCRATACRNMPGWSKASSRCRAISVRCWTAAYGRKRKNARPRSVCFVRRSIRISFTIHSIRSR